MYFQFIYFQGLEYYNFSYDNASDFNSGKVIFRVHFTTISILSDKHQRMFDFSTQLPSENVFSSWKFVALWDRSVLLEGRTTCTQQVHPAMGRVVEFESHDVCPCARRLWTRQELGQQCQMKLLQKYRCSQTNVSHEENTMICLP